MSATPRSILVIGAGELGLPVITHLSVRARAASYPTATINVLIRPSSLDSSDPKKQSELSHLRSLDARLIPGDIAEDDESSLTEIFKSFDTIISCTGFALGATGVQAKVARAVLAAGTAHYFPWQFGADYDAIGRGKAQDLFDEQLDVRDMLSEQTKTQWTIISVGIFMTFMFEKFWGVLDAEKGVCRALGSCDTKITATTPEDIGQCVAELVFGGVDVDGGEGKRRGKSGVVVKVAGDTKTYGEIAEIVENVLGKKMEREVWTVEELERVSREDPNDGLKKYRAVFAAGTGVAWDVEGSFNARRGIKTTSIREWVESTIK